MFLPTNMHRRVYEISYDVSRHYVYSMQDWLNNFQKSLSNTERQIQQKKLNTEISLNQKSNLSSKKDKINRAIDKILTINQSINQRNTFSLPECTIFIRK